MKIFSVKLNQKSFSGNSYDDLNQMATYFDPKSGKVGVVDAAEVPGSGKLEKDAVRKKAGLSQDAEISVYRWSGDYDDNGGMDKFNNSVVAKCKKAIKWARENGKTRVNYDLSSNDLDILPQDLRKQITNGID